MTDQEELVALRRMAELEARAGGGSTAAPTPAQTTQAPAPGGAEAFKRSLGLMGRSAIEGGLAGPSIVAGGLGGIYNVGADIAQGEGKGFRFKDPGQLLSQSLTNMGFPKPESGTEKVTDFLGQMGAGGLAMPIGGLFKPGPPAKLTPEQISTQRGLEAGLKIPPSQIDGGGAVSNALESFGGKAALKQQAILENKPIIDALAARHAGLKPGESITQSALEQVRAAQAAPYREVAQISPVAKRSLDKLLDTRQEMNLAFAEYNRNASRQALKDAKGLRTEVDRLEGIILREAGRAGKPGLADEVAEARTAMAKNFDIQRALNTATGGVNPNVLARLSDKQMLSGDADTIARFTKAHPMFVGAGEKTPAPGVSAINPIMSALLATGGYSTLGPAGLTAAAIPLLRGPARKALLSGARPHIPRGLLMPLFAGEEALDEQP